MPQLIIFLTDHQFPTSTILYQNSKCFDALWYIVAWGQETYTCLGQLCHSPLRTANSFCWQDYPVWRISSLREDIPHNASSQLPSSAPSCQIEQQFRKWVAAVRAAHVVVGIKYSGRMVYSFGHLEPAPSPLSCLCLPSFSPPTPSHPTTNALWTQLILLDKNWYVLFKIAHRWACALMALDPDTLMHMVLCILPCQSLLFMRLPASNLVMPTHSNETGQKGGEFVKASPGRAVYRSV